MNKTKKIISTMILSLFVVIQMNFLFNINYASAGGFWDGQLFMGNKSDEIGDAFGNNGVRDVREIAVSYIEIFLGLLGLIFVVLMLMAGFKYMTANGDDAITKKSLEQIKQAIIGLVIILAAYGITTFVALQINIATSGV